METKPAGFWIRLGALLLDGILFNGLAFLLGLFLLAAWQDGITELAQFLYALLLPVFWYGYTVGKRVFKIRIIHMDGTNVGIWTMIKRTIIGGLIYVLPILISVTILSFTVDTRIWLTFVQNNDLSEEFILSGFDFTILALGFFPSLILLVASAFMVGLSKSRRSIHDLIAGTYVTKQSPAETEKIDKEANEH
ncbi:MULTISPECIES: RDD family protein [Shouchella]|uniref:RDD family protein n=2 Tax=Shouchella TaxID=2893057 RepID=A0ABY7W396_9BACI|nr:MULTISPECIES: RDD family protein [Shouchella]MED4130597.1 RDD family protein [Shouchella miscanthi]WDF03349.1 RDD family protein [Shouchella hunanensis]